MVFGSVGPVFSFYQKKNYTINYFFKLRLIGLGSFSVKNIYQNKFSLTTHCTPPLHIYITHRMFGSTGPRASKRVEILDNVYLHSVLLLSGPAISMCLCVYVCVRVCDRERERVCKSVSVSVSFVFLLLPFPHKVVAL